MKSTFIEEFKKLEIKFEKMTSEEVNDNEMDNMDRLIAELPDTKIGGLIENKFNALAGEMYYGELQYLPNSLLHWISQCKYEV
mgnify:CR=1 FL=1|tara:strand:+ start:986 stop:1234 length:249 start_codon:yes stop_codon:yes gene_type:complete